VSNQKNILLISPFFFPEPISTGKFNTDIAIALSKKGHNVTVLCFHPFYPDWKIIKSTSKLANIKIIRGGKHLLFTKNTTVRRLLLEISFTFFVVRNIFKYQSKTDILINVFPPSLYFYFILPFLKKNIKIVGMVHDLQQIYASNKKGILNKLITFFIQKVDKKNLQYCNKLVFLSEEMKIEAERLYGLNKSKSTVQYPFHSLEETISNELSSILKNEKMNVVYSGAIGDKQNPYQLYQFFVFASNKIENIEFHIFSQGTIFDELRKTNKNIQIKFHNLVAREHLEELYMRSNLQIIPQKPNTSKGSFPSKLPNLLASGTNVLVITDKDSEIELFFKKQQLQKVVTSWNFDELLDDVKKSLTNTSKNNHQIKIAKELFTIDEMIAKILI
jgi:hypothetical protein